MDWKRPSANIMNNMFNLEKSIADWRKQMLAAGIKFPMPLEELENHLREEITQQIKSGFSEQKAFEISIQQIGQPKMLDCEFKKSERTFMKRNAKIVAGVIGLIVGAALLVPGTVQLRDELVMANGKFVLWLLGMVLVCWSAALFQQIFMPKAPTGNKTTPVKQPVKTGAGIVVLLLGLALMLPAAAQARREGMVEFAGLGCAVFGIALLIAGALVTFWPYKKRAA
jgi:uncharacterized membrane protein